MPHRQVNIPTCLLHIETAFTIVMWNCFPARYVDLRERVEGAALGHHYIAQDTGSYVSWAMPAAGKHPAGSAYGPGHGHAVWDAPGAPVRRLPGVPGRARAHAPGQLAQVCDAQRGQPHPNAHDCAKCLTRPLFPQLADLD